MPPNRGGAVLCARAWAQVKDVLFVPIAISYEKVPEPLGLLGTSNEGGIAGLLRPMLHHLSQGCGQVTASHPAAAAHCCCSCCC